LLNIINADIQHYKWTVNELIKVVMLKSRYGYKY